MGKARYKKVTDPDTGQKVYTGNGCDIHPDKKHRYKLQSEKDPDVRTIVGPGGSGRAAVAIKRPKGTDYIPVIEAQARVVPTDPEGLLDMPKESDFGLTGQDYGIGEEYYQFCNRQREWHASSEGLDFARREGEVEQHNADVRTADLEWRKSGVIATDTAEYAYKVFRLLSSDLVELAKGQGLTPQGFYKQYRSELHRLADEATYKTGCGFKTYLIDNAPKFYAAVFESGETIGKPEPDPDGLDTLRKKLASAEKRAQKAFAEAYELRQQIAERSPTVHKSNIPGAGVEARRTQAIMSAYPRSKKQQQREDRRARRRGKRSGKTSERIAA